MEMGMEWWNWMDWGERLDLVFKGLTAFGILSSTIVALYLANRKKGRFKVKKFQVNKRIFHHHGNTKELHHLIIFLENLTEVPMEILGVELDFIQKKNEGTVSYSVKVKDELVAPFYQYEFKWKLSACFGVQTLSLNIIKKTNLTVITSFGRLTIKMKKKQMKRIFDAIVNKSKKDTK